MKRLGFTEGPISETRDVHHAFRHRGTSFSPPISSVTVIRQPRRHRGGFVQAVPIGPPISQSRGGHVAEGLAGTGPANTDHLPHREWQGRCCGDGGRLRAIALWSRLFAQRDSKRPHGGGQSPLRIGAGAVEHGVQRPPDGRHEGAIVRLPSHPRQPRPIGPAKAGCGGGIRTR